MTLMNKEQLKKLKAKDVEEIRRVTGANLVDAKNAMFRASGDEDIAIEILRDKLPTQLDAQAILDYTVCALYYDLKHRNKVPAPRQYGSLMNERFKKNLTLIAYHFFFKKQGRHTPSKNALLSKWEKLWFPEEMTAQDIALEQHLPNNNLITFSNKAVAAISKFHDDFADDDWRPVSIHDDFIVPIDEKIHLKGTIDLLLKNKNQYKAIKFSMSHENPFKLSIELAMWKIAINHTRPDQNAANTQYSVYNLSSAIMGFQDIPQPTDDDVDMVKFWANDIRESKEFVPRRGRTIYCRGCVFDKECLNFSFSKATS